MQMSRNMEAANLGNTRTALPLPAKLPPAGRMAGAAQPALSVTPAVNPELRTLALAREALDATYTGVMWLDADDNVHRQVVGPDAPEPAFENALFTHTCRADDVAVVLDMREDTHLRESRLVREFGMRFFATYPIQRQGEEKIGVLYACGPRATRTEDEYIPLLAHAASCLAVELRSLTLEKSNRTLSRQLAEAERRALVDPLTSVWNHSGIVDLLHRRLEQAERENDSLTLLFIDIDQFKQINDTLGHQPGNQVLQTVCRRIESALRPYDEVGRYGGDELVAIVTGRSEPMLQELAERVRSAIADTPVETRAGPVNVTISIGIASTGADNLGTLEDLMLRADAALYQAKRLGRNRVHLSRPH
ncbi:MAG TPA: sensor domain-containing diguanylate cyclase [Gammaproteobacteria bacterium]|nr:sensor domain-containing diguanylate cyclase [Gammaproteobacteria bacterium]